MRTAACLFLAFALAACGEPVRDDHYTNAAQPADAPARPPVRQQQAVRVGEMGPNFDACAGAGTTRHLKAGEKLPVRAAPFESAEESGAVAGGARFFVCTRSHDQKWLGIVYEPGGTLAESCGVSAPSTTRRDYQGPCRSGWVSSAFVRLIAGVDAGAGGGGEQEPAANQAAPVPFQGG